MEITFVTNDSVTDGSLSLLSRKPLVSLPYVTVLGLAAVIGTAGNLLVVGTLATDRRNQNIGNVLIINLAVSDLIVTALINPFAIVGVTEGEKFFENRSWLCELLANLCVTSCVCSLLTIGSISINRYVYICHNATYHRIYSKWRCTIICIIPWVVGVLIDLPSLLGWSRHGFDQKTHKCLWDRTFQYSYTVFFVVCGIMIPLTVITAFYAQIFFYMGRAKRKLGHHHHDPFRKTLASTMRQAKLMCMIFVAFTTCWSPYVIVLLFDRYDEYPIEVHLYASLVAHLHASINFVIYGLANSRVRKSYVKFIRRNLFCCPEDYNQTAFFSEVHKHELQSSCDGRASNNDKRKHSQRTSNSISKKVAFFLDDPEQPARSLSSTDHHKTNGTCEPEHIELQDYGQSSVPEH